MSTQKSLVIVESPAKARTINRYLGEDYVVASSVGHVRDLPKGGGQTKGGGRRKKAAADAEQRLVRRMGIDPGRKWQAHYEVLPGKEKVIRDLKKLAGRSAAVYLATDMDREGEAIAWHLQELLGASGKDDALSADKFRRVSFNEITRQAIVRAFENAGGIDMNRVNAQQARRFLDRIVGFMLSPLLWDKVARGLSAGRVQSVAVRLVVEREREIRAFHPEEYWEIHADVQNAAGQGLHLQLKKRGGKNFRPDNRADAEAAVEELRGAEFLVQERQDKQVREHPGPPLITASLQQMASVRLGFGVRRTMSLAQGLYEAGHITYMRTDSTNLSRQAVEQCRDWIVKQYGQKYLPEKPRFYASKKDSQEAHEAIRPTDVRRKGESLPNTNRDAQRLYELIYSRFVACQMPPALYAHTSLKVRAGECELRTAGRTMLFDGFTRAAAPQKKKTAELPSLPDVKEGEKLRLIKLEPSQHFTRPPPRYSEAALVRELEKRGIGRPSTYAAIIATIQDRGYVSVRDKRFHAEKIGDIVTDRLVENFTDLMDYRFTADMEQTLDKVAAGDIDWRQALDDFYAEFCRRLERASQEQEKGGMRANPPVPTAIACPDCSRPMQIRNAATGVFLGCSGYGLEKDQQCKKTLPLTPEEETAPEDASPEQEQDGEKEARHLRTLRRCPKCDTAMEAFFVDTKRKLHICGNSPNCDGNEVETGSFALGGYQGPELECDRCGAVMELKNGRFGKYFGCTAEDCKNTRKLLRNGQPAPPKMTPIPMPELRCSKVDDHFVLRDGAAGLFLAASGFPRHRETRSPLVEEILPLRNQLEAKYAFLTQAPTEDDQGNKTQIRYDRKNAVHYVRTEQNGKPTGWSARYEKGLWVAHTGPVRGKGGRKGKGRKRSKKTAA